MRKARESTPMAEKVVEIERAKARFDAARGEMFRLTMEQLVDAGHLEVEVSGGRTIGCRVTDAGEAAGVHETLAPFIDGEHPNAVEVAGAECLRIGEDLRRAERQLAEAILQQLVDEGLLQRTGKRGKEGLVVTKLGVELIDKEALAAA